MSLLLTLVATFIFVLIAVLIFLRTGPPVYRLEKENVVELLRLVLNGNATTNDWEVFLGLPIRHNEILENIRLRCQVISKVEGTNHPSDLLTEQGIKKIQKLLIELLETDA